MNKINLGRKDVMILKTRCAVTETALRARNIIIQGASTEPFGTGIGLAPMGKTGSLPLRVLEIHPKSDAAAKGVKLGDLLFRIDGKSLKDLSTDGTSKGLFDPKTQLIRGQSNSYNSKVKFTLFRFDNSFGKTIEIEVQRKIWSARHLGCPPKPEWDGTDKSPK